MTESVFFIAGHRLRVQGDDEVGILLSMSDYVPFLEPTEAGVAPDCCPFCNLIASDDWSVRFGEMPEEAALSWQKMNDEEHGAPISDIQHAPFADDGESKCAAGSEAAGLLLYQFFFPNTRMLCRFGRVGETYFFRMSPSGTQQTPLLMCYRRGDNIVYSTHTNNIEVLHFALWFAFAMLSAGIGTTPVHASTIVYNHRAVLFLGESGTGKSTHTALWLKNIAGSRLLNDDSPLLSVSSQSPLVYGSPWSGKTPCFHNVSYPLQAIVRLSQAPANSIRRLRPLEAVAALLPSCPPALAHDDSFGDLLIDIIHRTLSTVPVYHLSCLPDAGAAQLCFSTLFAGQQ
jgi:hypothetical protein